MQTGEAPWLRYLGEGRRQVRHRAPLQPAGASEARREQPGPVVEYGADPATELSECVHGQLQAESHARKKGK